MSETFCKFLKNGLVYNNNTDQFTVSPCCYFSKNYTIDPTTDPAEQLIKHKQKWLNEDFKKTCDLCINAEQSGLYSYRQTSFDQITDESDQLNFLTVAVNKKCNLACPSCNSEFSSFWHQENSRHNVIQSSNIHQIHQEDRQGIITDKFIQLLAEQDLTALTYIKFGGGEPLMTDTHEKIMALIPTPGNVIVQYTSNFSIMPGTAVFQMWEKFKLVKWVASIDGVGEQFSFLRWPYKWNKLENFVVEAIDNVPGNVMFGVEHTINPLNIFYFDQFQTWFDQQFSSNRYGDKSDLNIHSCNGNLGLEHTPMGLRKKIKNKYGPTHPISISLDQSPFSGSTTKLVKYLDQLDQWRGTNWRQIFPEIQEFFNA